MWMGVKGKGKTKGKTHLEGCHVMQCAKLGLTSPRQAGAGPRTVRW